jgi:hypothetical protein
LIKKAPSILGLYSKVNAIGVFAEKAKSQVLNGMLV